MKPGARIPALLRELADEVDALLADAPARQRARPVRQPPKFQVVPNDLQRQRAAGVLRAKGLAR